MSRTVLKAVLRAETFGLAHACGSEIVIQHYLKQMCKTNVKIQVFINNETLFNVIIRNETTIESGLMIDISASREA